MNEGRMKTKDEQLSFEHPFFVFNVLKQTTRLPTDVGEEPGTAGAGAAVPPTGLVLVVPVVPVPAVAVPAASSHHTWKSKKTVNWIQLVFFSSLDYTFNHLQIGKYQDIKIIPSS